MRFAEGVIEVLDEHSGDLRRFVVRAKHVTMEEDGTLHLTIDVLEEQVA